MLIQDALQGAGNAGANGAEDALIDPTLVDKLLDYGAWGPPLLAALAVLVIGWWITRLVTGIARRAMTSRQLDPMLTGFLAHMVYMVLMTLVIITALGQIGVKTTSFIAILGAAGLAIGFALQGSLSNFAAGVMVIFFRPFKVGDYIEAGGTEGLVEEIMIFATVLKTRDNKKIIVPNAALTDGNIVNHTAEPTRRIDMVFGISYSDDIPQAEGILRAILERDQRILDEPRPDVLCAELGDSSVNFYVRPWVKTEDYFDVLFHVTREVKMRFDAEGVSIPFPQRDVHLHQVPA